MNFDFLLSQAWLEGMLGGAALGLARLVLTFIGLAHGSTETHYGRLFLSHVVAAIFFSILGGAVAWGMEGRAGNFTAGIGAMLLLSLFAGKYMSEQNDKEG
ncbi:hypothetical protein [Paenarthrobacter sp. NPDC090522]|uniref:hypothetical protein n=1 Tax=Paenarthrobacter sp. NPDC090522 TaxID=3364383 RepID=UPI0038066D50